MDGYERYSNDSNGGSFVMGLIAGTILGAGLGLLFAPKTGAELRNQLSEQAGNLADTAARGYRRAASVANDLAGRGRDLYDQASDVVARTSDRARDVASRTADAARDAMERG